MKLEPGAVFTLPKASTGINRTTCFYEGNAITVAETLVEKYTAIELKADVDVELKAGKDSVRIILLQIKPFKY